MELGILNVLAHIFFVQLDITRPTQNCLQCNDSGHGPTCKCRRLLRESAFQGNCLIKKVKVIFFTK